MLRITLPLRTFLPLILVSITALRPIQGAVGDDVFSFSKGSVAAGVTLACALSIPTLAENFYSRLRHTTVGELPRNTPEAVYTLSAALALAYAVSKLAPFSRESLLLKNPPLLDNHPRIITDSQGKALLKGAATAVIGGVSLVTALALINNTINHTKSRSETALQVGTAAGCLYTCYKALPYAWDHIKRALN